MNGCWQIDAFCEVFFYKEQATTAKAFLQAILQTLSPHFKGYHCFSWQVTQLSPQG